MCPSMNAWERISELFEARRYEEILDLLAGMEAGSAQATHEDPANHDWWKARALHRLGRCIEAIPLYERLVGRVVWPDTRGEGILRNALAECYRQSGQSLTRARQLYLEVLEREPDNATVQNNLGLLEMTEGHFEEAAVRFRAVLERELPPNQPADMSAAITMDNLAGALLQTARQHEGRAAQSQISEAVELLESARTAFLRAGEEELTAENAVSLGRALLAAGETSRAEQCVSSALAAGEGRPALRRVAPALRAVAAKIAAARGRNDEARSLYGALLEDVHAAHLRPSILEALASISIAEKDWRAAAALHEQRLALLADRAVDKAKWSSYDDRLPFFAPAESIVESMLAIATEANDADLMEQALRALVQWRGAFLEAERILVAAAHTAGADVRAAWGDVERGRHDLINHLLGDPGPQITDHLAMSGLLQKELAKAHGRFVERFARDPVCEAAATELGALLHGSTVDLLARLPGGAAFVC